MLFLQQIFWNDIHFENTNYIYIFAVFRRENSPRYGAVKAKSIWSLNYNTLRWLLRHEDDNEETAHASFSLMEWILLRFV